MEVDLGSIQWCNHCLSCGPCNGPSHQRCQDFVVDRYLQSAESQVLCTTKHRCKLPFMSEFCCGSVPQSTASHRCCLQPSTGVNLQLCQNFVVDQYLKSTAIHRCCVQPSTATGANLQLCQDFVGDQYMQSTTSHRCCVQPTKAPASRAVRNLLHIITYYLKQTKRHRCCVQPSSRTNLQSC